RGYFFTRPVPRTPYMEVDAMRRATRMTLAPFGLVLVVGAVAAQAAKAPDLKEIMKRMNKGHDALMVTVKKQLQEPSPNWADVQKQTKECVPRAPAMEQSTPPAGGKDSWQQQTRTYTAVNRELDEAAQRKDQKTALTAHGKLKTTCMSCHKA